MKNSTDFFSAVLSLPHSPAVSPLIIWLILSREHLLLKQVVLTIKAEFTKHRDVVFFCQSQHDLQLLYMLQLK